jgi:hypothetical protein
MKKSGSRHFVSWIGHVWQYRLVEKIKLSTGVYSGLTLISLVREYYSGESFVEFYRVWKLD